MSQRDNRVVWQNKCVDLTGGNQGDGTPVSHFFFQHQILSSQLFWRYSGSNLGLLQWQHQPSLERRLLRQQPPSNLTKWSIRHQQLWNRFWPFLELSNSLDQVCFNFIIIHVTRTNHAVLFFFQLCERLLSLGSSFVFHPCTPKRNITQSS